MKTIFLMWFKPRQAVRFLEASSRLQLLYMMSLCLLYFLQVSAFILLMDNHPIAPLLTSKGLMLVIYFSLLLVIGVFVVIQASAFAFWTAAKCFNGQATLPQTRTAMIWTLLGSSPIGFFWVLLYFAFKHQALLGKAAGIVGGISYIGFLATVIYMLVVLISTLSELSNFNLWRAFCTVIVGSVILAAIFYTLRPVYYFCSP